LHAEGSVIEERWVPVAGYLNYKVSDLGRVKRVASKNCRVERELKQSPRNGYPSVDLCKNGQRRSHSVHKLVAVAFIPNPAALPEVNHKSAVRTNCRADNLEWTNRIGNAQHAHDNGLQDCKGEKNGQAKLTPRDVRAIRAYRNRVVHGVAGDLARVFNVSPTTIRDIWSGRTWGHL
jgi:hypothetical protein